MKNILTAAVIMASSFAYAGSFECSAPDYGLRLKLHHEADPKIADLTLSADQSPFGPRIVERLGAGAGMASSSELVYNAVVDLRFADASRKNERVLGTKLGDLKTITASVFFNENTPARQNLQMAGQLRWLKRNGQIGATDLVCEPDLKR